MAKFLQSLVDFLTGAAGSMFVALSWLRIEEQSADPLSLSANGRLIVADLRTRTISSCDKPIAHFDAIETIDIKHVTAGKRREWWVVNLGVCGRRTIRIGKTADDVQASIAAAALSTITGRRVRVLQGWGL